MKKVLKSTFIFNSLKSSILSEKILPGSKLPSIPQLMKSFNVSKMTIQKVIDELEKEGLILRSKGSGIYAKEKEEKQEYPQLILPRKKFKQIADQILDEISSGKLRVGNAMPLLKYLQYEYRTSRKTMHQALDIIEKKGLIFRKGSGFMIGSRTSPIKSNKVVVLGNRRKNDMLDIIMRYTTLKDEFIPEFEREINRYGVSAQYFRDLIDQVPVSFEKLSKENTLGFLYLFDHELGIMSGFDSFELLKKELSVLERTKLPIALYNVVPLSKEKKQQLIECCKSCKNICVLGIQDDYNAGKETAVFLASQGFSSVAFFSLYNALWSRQRFEGVKDGLKNLLGKEPKILHYTADMDERHGSMLDFLFDRNMFSKTSQFLKQSLSNAFEQYPFTHLDPSGQLIRFSTGVIRVDFAMKTLEPFFEQALKEKDIQVWICPEMIQTLVAAEFLQKRGIKYPDQINLIGFDDKKHGNMHGITAHDFNNSTMGYLAAHFLLEDIPIKIDRNKLAVCSGNVIVRGSTRKIFGASRL